MLNKERREAAHLVLRAGLAFALLYPAYAGLSDPTSWASYFPDFVRAIPVDTTFLLHAFGVVEAALALWLLSGWRIHIPAALTALLLVGIVAVNVSEFEVLFRDLSLAALALGLALWPAGEKRSGAEASGQSRGDESGA